MHTQQNGFDYKEVVSSGSASPDWSAVMMSLVDFRALPGGWLSDEAVDLCLSSCYG